MQSQKKPGMFGQVAGTAAGVAAVNIIQFRIYLNDWNHCVFKFFFFSFLYQGTVIGDKISGRNEPAASSGSDSASSPCKYEEEQMLDCIENQTNLQACELYKKALLDCKRKHSTSLMDIHLF